MPGKVTESVPKPALRNESEKHAENMPKTCRRTYRAKKHTKQILKTVPNKHRQQMPTNSAKRNVLRRMLKKCWNKVQGNDGKVLNKLLISMMKNVMKNLMKNVMKNVMKT